MLKPLPPPRDNSQQNAYRKDMLPPPRTCEACGKVVSIGHDAINCIIVIGSPGHPDLLPFQCPAEEHWACCPNCWAKVAHACVDEHMREILRQIHGV